VRGVYRNQIKGYNVRDSQVSSSESKENRMRQGKNLILTILVILIFFSCTKTENSKTSSKIQLVDYAGREISLTTPAERVIVMADNAFQIIKELDAIDKVVGLDSKTKGYWDLYLISKTNPELETLPDLGKTKSPNYEQILSLNPDLILLKGNKDIADDLQLKTGVPVVSIVSKHGYDFEIYRVIGKLLGKEETAETVINELKVQKEKLETLLKSVPESEKKSAYIVVQNSKNNFFRTLKNADSLTLANISNVATSAKKVDEWGFAEISKEEFLNWEPDFIFLDEPVSKSSISKQNLLDDSTYQFLTAVKNNQIFVTHSFSCPKDYVFVIAEAYYYANIAYPHIISEKEYKTAINSIFEKTYGLKNYYEEWKKNHN